jgi:hypothetical protein
VAAADAGGTETLVALMLSILCLFSDLFIQYFSDTVLVVNCSLLSVIFRRCCLYNELLSDMFVSRYFLLVLFSMDFSCTATTVPYNALAPELTTK